MNIDFDDMTRSGVRAGGFAGLSLPSGEVICVKLEYIQDGTAYIRTKGFNRFKVSEELIVQTNETKTTLPEWFAIGVILTNGLDIVNIGKGVVTLSDGHEYSWIDILIGCTPKLKAAACLDKKKSETI